MPNLYVKYLYYTLNVKEGVSFKDCGPIESKLGSFELRLESNKLECKMLKRYPTVEAARKEVEDYLKTWEIYAALELGDNEIEFMYDSAKIVKYDSSGDLSKSSEITQISKNSEKPASLIVSHKRDNLPIPPQRFHRNEKVQILWNRYDDYLRRKEKLLGMAYFCLNFIEDDAGGRKEASKKYKIDKKVLDKIGELSSTKGKLGIDARKAKDNAGPLTDEEVKWINETIRKMIIRVGEYKDNLPSLNLIDMSSLPDIK